MQRITSVPMYLAVLRDIHDVIVDWCVPPTSFDRPTSLATVATHDIGQQECGVAREYDIVADGALRVSFAASRFSQMSSMRRPRVFATPRLNSAPIIVLAASLASYHGRPRQWKC